MQKFRDGRFNTLQSYECPSVILGSLMSHLCVSSSYSKDVDGTLRSYNRSAVAVK